MAWSWLTKSTVLRHVVDCEVMTFAIILKKCHVKISSAGHEGYIQVLALSIPASVITLGAWLCAHYHQVLSD